MPKVIETTVFKFEELNEKAKQFAVNHYRDNCNPTAHFSDVFDEGCMELIKSKGFEEPVLQYSLSYCQGDGLSFRAKKYNNMVDLFKEVLGPGKDKTAQLLADNCTQVISGNNGHYQYAHKNQIDLFLENWTSSINVENTDRIDEVVKKVLAKFEDIFMDLCKEMEDNGYKILEGMNSDKEIIETLIANEYDFEEDGRRF